MTAVTAAFPHILVAYMVLVMPWIGRYKYRRLQRQIAEEVPNARLRFYRITLIQQLLLVAGVVMFARLGGVPLPALGIGSPYSWGVTRSLLIAFALAIAASIILFRCTGDRFLRRLLKMAGALLPANPAERWFFGAVSIGAGLTEELLFRGLLLWYLTVYLPRLNAVELVIVSSLLFGFCHIYQGWMGVIGTGVMGAAFASLYLSTGSLLVPAAVHAMVDLRILAILTPGRLRTLQCEPADQALQAGPTLRSG